MNISGGTAATGGNSASRRRKDAAVGDAASCRVNLTPQGCGCGGCGCGGCGILPRLIDAAGSGISYGQPLSLLSLKKPVFFCGRCGILPRLIDAAGSGISRVRLIDAAGSGISCLHFFKSEKNGEKNGEKNAKKCEKISASSLTEEEFYGILRSRKNWKGFLVD